jgi:hypothetical protein
MTKAALDRGAASSHSGLWRHLHPLGRPSAAGALQQLGPWAGPPQVQPRVPHKLTLTPDLSSHRVERIRGANQLVMVAR